MPPYSGGPFGSQYSANAWPEPEQELVAERTTASGTIMRAHMIRNEIDPSAMFGQIPTDGWDPAGWCYPIATLRVGVTTPTSTNIVWTTLTTTNTPLEVDPLFGEAPPKDALRVERTAAGEGPSFVLQRVPDVLRLAGTTVTLELWARSDAPAELLVYFYLQPDSARTEARGSVAKHLALGPAWRCYRYTTTIPSLERDEPLGKNNHAEIALCLPAAAGACALELTGVRLTQGAY